MAGDNVGSWFAVGIIGFLITGGMAAVVPFLPGADDYALQLTVFLVVVAILFGLITLMAFAGFLNLVVRNLRDLNERISRRY